MRKPGRPLGSQIRQNIVEILYFYKRMHGYDIYKIYCEVFPEVTMRSIYYHLKKGAALGEFRVYEIKKKEGNYSWGSTVQNIVYELDKSAKPMIDARVKKHFEVHRK